MLGKMSSGIKCVVFDFDDTLADTKRVVELIKKIEPDKKFLAGSGWVFSKREFEKARKIMENKVENQRQKPSKNKGNIYAQELLKVLKVPYSKKLAEGMVKAYWKEKEKNLKLMPHVKKTLKFLKKRKLKLCVVSNISVNTNKKAAKKLGILKYFTEFFTSYQHGGIKSELKIFYNLLKKINKGRKNKINPEECLMVGNNAGEDGAAKKLGMKVALLKPTLKGKEHLEKIKPDFMLDDLLDLKRIIKS